MKICPLLAAFLFFGSLFNGAYGQRTICPEIECDPGDEIQIGCDCVKKDKEPVEPCLSPCGCDSERDDNCLFEVESKERPERPGGTGPFDPNEDPKDRPDKIHGGLAEKSGITNLRPVSAQGETEKNDNEGIHEELGTETEEEEIRRKRQEEICKNLPEAC